MSDAARDRWLAVLMLAFAASYVSMARSIEDSLLADAVGAGGVPQGVGLMIGLAALLLFAKSWVGQAGAPAQAAQTEEPGGLDKSGIARTVGLVLLLSGYAAVLPWLGYVVSVVLLLLASGWLAGAPLRLPLVGTALVGGPGLWLLFDGLLQVSMPVGRLWGG